MSVVRNERTTVDPETGATKKTVVTERVITTKTFRAMAVDDHLNQYQYQVQAQAQPHYNYSSANNAINNNNHNNHSYNSHSSGTQSPVRVNHSIVTANTLITSPRTIRFRQTPFRDISFDKIGDALIVTRIKPNSACTQDVHVGDSITEINGQPAAEIKNYNNYTDEVTLKITSTPLHQGPSVFYRAISDYNGTNDAQLPSNLHGLQLKKGEVIQAFCKDSHWIQGRKVNDIGQVGACPISAVGDQVSMLTPYGRRALVLLGVPGVGRRTLKTMLLAHLPQYFTTAIPYTSRPPKTDELEGREYYFRTKDEMQKRIRSSEMIEWGELGAHIYGTSKETVRSCIRGGRVCVLDCSPQALNHIYNSEFMPFVVLIAPADLDELERHNRTRTNPHTEEQLKSFIQENRDILAGKHAKQIHLVLVNRDLDTTFKRLIEALNQLRNEIQWIPESWLRR